MLRPISGTFLDHLFIKARNNVKLMACIFKIDITDHNPIALSIKNFLMCQNEPIYYKFYLNYKNLIIDLQNETWDSI